MTVRGAPALGVTAAMGMALAARTALATCGGDPAGFRGLRSKMRPKAYSKRGPTAYNLPWALKEMERVWSDEGLAPEDIARTWSAGPSRSTRTIWRPAGLSASTGRN